MDKKKSQKTRMFDIIIFNKRKIRAKQFLPEYQHQKELKQ